MRYEPDPNGGEPIVIATPEEVNAMRGRVVPILLKCGVKTRHVGDLLQDTLLVALIALRERRMRGSEERTPESIVLGYLFLTARHLAANHRRLWSTKREIPASLIREESVDMAGPDPMRQIEARDALRLLARMRPVAAAVLMRTAFGLTLQEIEAETGIRRKVGHWHLQKARRAFRRMLARRPVQPMPETPRKRKKGR